MATKRTQSTVSHPIIAEFHFSPMEHAIFQELHEEADITQLVDRLFGIDVPQAALAR